MTERNKVIEGWTGPGKYDANIEPLKMSEDGLHIDMKKWGMYEWWYFDAHLETGQTVVVFFHAKSPNPGPTQGKTGMEIVLLRPDGKRFQKFISYSKSEFEASRDKPEVTIGKNTLRVKQEKGELPIYEIKVKEKNFECEITYKATVNGWKPGTGDSKFGELGTFSWVVPFPRATVEGTIKDGDELIQVSGIGYHDHNWLDFPFNKIINYWMWGRIYSENYTISYAFIQCNSKVDNHQVKVLMLADGQKAILSTGDFSFQQDDFEYNPKAKQQFPNQITINVPERMKVVLKVNKILEAIDMLNNFNPVFSFLAKYLLRIKPGYFRLLSDFELEVTKNGNTVKESGTTLHEIVIQNEITT